jgi:hypothetical protein
VSVAFILVNSIAGLSGHLSSVRDIPSPAVYWGLAAITGGLIGSYLGSRRFAPITLRRLLAAVLVVAAVKLAVF